MTTMREAVHLENCFLIITVVQCIQHRFGQVSQTCGKDHLDQMNTFHSRPLFIIIKVIFIVRFDNTDMCMFL